MGRPRSSAARAAPAGLRLATPAGFRLAAVLGSHGWIDLAPFEAGKGGFLTVLAGPSGPVEILVRECASGLRVRPAASGLPEDSLLRQVRRMLGLDVDLRAFHRRCRAEPGLRWIARGGHGRFLRAPTPFEDFAKTLLTTNCTWTQTRAMVQRLVAAFGAESEPSGRRAFPTPSALVRAPEPELARVGMGYRARALRELAAAAEGGALDRLDAIREPETFRAGVLALRGFGPYAAASLALIRGEGAATVIDSWAVARARERFGSRRAATPRAIARRYACHGEHQGLVAWFDLNQDWIRGA
jgi:3-methyladenine DNA glycosylase/8-oxoguanine DNA glycosylase